MLRAFVCLMLLGSFAGNACAAEGEWAAKKGPLMTRWAKDVSPEKVLPEYPRPQMVRKEWVNLNGLWQYAVRPKAEDKAEKWDGQILVPFAIESALSGVMKTVKSDERLWYRRTFARPAMQKDGRLLLHFGAVDWEATVYVNGKEVGSHRGGYTPFSFDITDALKEGDEQELVVAVWDPTDRGYQPRGKQVNDPKGIWYTSVTGIWQTVWLEPVPKLYLKSLTMTPVFRDGKPSRLAVRGVVAGGKGIINISSEKSGFTGVYPVVDDGSDFEFSGDFAFEDVEVWTPDNPKLHTLIVETKTLNQEGVDRLEAYTACRTIEFKKDSAGVNRLFLNNKPLFQYGPLDQGWWPDGLYTAPTDEALAFDVEMTKKLGMNMCRKHVKVEPARWYYHCDRLGLMVWQDMPNGDRHIGPNDPDITRSAESEANYRREWQEIMDACRNYPCIVAWVPFNEGWGQFKTNEILEWTKKHDPTRLVDGPSGWSDRGGGDMHDMHMYPGPGMFPVSEKRTSVLGEFGGLGWPVKGHLWQEGNRNWGYRTYHSKEELTEQYERLIRKLRPLIGNGLAAAIYTQTTDVESEVNGLMTYDREVVKFDVERMAELHKKLYGPQPKIEIKTVVPTSEREAQTWKYTTTKPGEGWQKPGFDDSAWKEGKGGFGDKNPPGSRVRTKWDTREIWLRRTFKLGAVDISRLQFRIHHDEDAEIYLNDVLAGKTEGYTTEYTQLELDAEARKTLEQGETVIAVHCRQTGGGQYIDVGLVEVIVTEPTAK